jgi:hypothetical protein
MLPGLPSASPLRQELNSDKYAEEKFWRKDYLEEVVASQVLKHLPTYLWSFQKEHTSKVTCTN